MIDDRKRVTVRIAGINYQLAAAENEDYIRALAIQADEMIRRVQQSNPYLNQTMATVLALVNALDENGQSDFLSHQAVRQRDEAERKLTEARTELNHLREQNWDMKKDLLKMQGLLSEFEKHLEKLQDPEPEADEELESVEMTAIEAVDATLDFEEIDPEDAVPPPLNAYQQSRLEDFI